MQRAVHDGKSKLRTIVAVKTISTRPYKIYVEVRRTDDKKKYTLTLASRDESKMERISSTLDKHGYKHTMYTDSYGFTRIHIRNLNYNNLSYLLVMLKYWAREPHETEEKSLNYA